MVGKIAGAAKPVWLTGGARAGALCSSQGCRGSPSETGFVSSTVTATRQSGAATAADRADVPAMDWQHAICLAIPAVSDASSVVCTQGVAGTEDTLLQRTLTCASAATGSTDCPIIRRDRQASMNLVNRLCIISVIPLFSRYLYTEVPCKVPGVFRCCFLLFAPDRRDHRFGAKADTGNEADTRVGGQPYPFNQRRMYYLCNGQCKRVWSFGSSQVPPFNW